MSLRLESLNELTDVTESHDINVVKHSSVDFDLTTNINLFLFDSENGNSENKYIELIIS